MKHLFKLNEDDHTALITGESSLLGMIPDGNHRNQQQILKVGNSLYCYIAMHFCNQEMYCF